MSKSELTIARHIAAPPSVVWDAWSDPAKLAQWWIPAPIICRVDKLDLTPGGGFVTRMREGDRKRHQQRQRERFHRLLGAFGRRSYRPGRLG